MRGLSATILLSENGEEILDLDSVELCVTLWMFYDQGGKGKFPEDLTPSDEDSQARSAEVGF